MSDDFNILVVNDDSEKAGLTGNTLSSGLPCDIILTTSAKEATEVLLQKNNVAVLFCDYDLPDLIGSNFLKKAKEINPPLVCVMIADITDMESAKREFETQGLWKCIKKPWKAEGLISAGREALNHYEESLKRKHIFTDLAGNTVAVAKSDIATERVRPKTPRVSLSSSIAQLFRNLFSGKYDPAKLIDKRYDIRYLIKEGGTGAVYKAHDTLLDIPVAIKVLSPHFTKDKYYVQILFDEARICMQLSHKHIVRLHNLQESRGHYYIIMEFIDGCTFKDILSVHGKLPSETVLQVLNVAADALGHAHRNKIFHRDLKPHNLMLTNDGVLKIIDFGIACLAGSRNRFEVSGTPYYMSPEVLNGQPQDERVDIYSLGVVIHELLTGDVPFGDEPPVAENPHVQPVISEEIKPEIRQVLKKALEYDREDRWSNVYSFAKAFRQAYYKGKKKKGAIAPKR